MKKVKKINIQLNYKSSVAVLPTSVIKCVDRAKKFDIKVLLCLASSDALRGEDCVARIAKSLDCDEGEVTDSLSFWNGTGIIDVRDADADDAATVAVAPKRSEGVTEAEKVGRETPKRTKVSELPQYTTEELNKMLEKNEGICELIDECQQILGKIFNTADVKILMGLIDFLGLDGEYILVLMHYCAEIEKRSMRYLEKVAVSCLDDGITEAKDLQAELRRREEKKDAENKIRNMFGIGSRSFTKKEKSCISAWRESYGFELDVIGKAYEITVNSTGKASIPYANAIIEKWYTENLKTLEDVEAYLLKYKADHGGEAMSFDVNDFFDAALSRTYSKKKQGE